MDGKPASRRPPAAKNASTGAILARKRCCGGKAKHNEPVAAPSEAP